jgi:C1A family cysteine protease
MNITRTNTKPSKPDHRDLVYRPANSHTDQSVSLREHDSRVENQGNIGSCTANAITSAYEVMVNARYPEYSKELSSLYVYYHSRVFTNDLERDSGSYIRDGLKSAKNYGICTEELWPHVTENLSVQPHPQCYLDASKRRITEYNILYTNYEIKEILTGKRPVVVCIEIFYDFLDTSKEYPYIQLPENYAYSMGYHAVVIMGYDDSTNQFLIKNSYGTGWGDNGYAWIPYDYITYYGCERWCFDINNQNN